MPHKHKRKRDEDTSNFDLAPNAKARPLAAYNKASIFSNDNDEQPNKRRKTNIAKPKKSQDDTPKAFARMMAWQSTGKRPGGLDDGSKKLKKKQRKEPKQNSAKNPAQPELEITSSPVSILQNSTRPNPTTTRNTATAKSQTTIPQILPGESLSSFSLRVDQSLPLTSLTRTTQPLNPLPEDLQKTLKKHQKTTKHNKRLQKMQADWRATESKLREKEDADKDEMEDQHEEESLLWSGVRAVKGRQKGKKKRQGQDGDDDPWRELEKRRREETRQKSLQDVVKAPPVLKTVKSKFKTRQEDFDLVDWKRMRGGEAEDVLVDVGDVPGAVGSLRRREELNATRKEVIEGYRKMHGWKRGLGERLNMSKVIMI